MRAPRRLLATEHLIERLCVHEAPFWRRIEQTGREKRKACAGDRQRGEVGEGLRSRRRKPGERRNVWREPARQPCSEGHARLRPGERGPDRIVERVGGTHGVPVGGIEPSPAEVRSAVSGDLIRIA